jgi:hypothetical protein
MTAAVAVAETIAPVEIIPGTAAVTAMLTMRVAATVTMSPPREVRIFERAVVAAETIAAVMRSVTGEAAEARMADRAALGRVVRGRGSESVQAVAIMVSSIAVGLWQSLKGSDASAAGSPRPRESFAPARIKVTRGVAWFILARVVSNGGRLTSDLLREDVRTR